MIEPELLYLWAYLLSLFPAKPRKRLPYKLGEIDGAEILVVDGNIVKFSSHMDFVEGGHDLVYPDFIPAGQIWLDGHLDYHELPFVLVHEVTERRLMATGMKYDDAHEAANEVEKRLRIEESFGG